MVMVHVAKRSIALLCVDLKSQTRLHSTPIPLAPIHIRRIDVRSALSALTAALDCGAVIHRAAIPGVCRELDAMIEFINEYDASYYNVSPVNLPLHCTLLTLVVSRNRSGHL